MKTRILSLAIAAAALIPMIGCAGATMDGLLMNVWRGFGLGIGFIPAGIVEQLLSGVLPTV